MVVIPRTADSLVGAPWVAFTIDGVVPVISPQPQLRWSDPEQVNGTGGCNGFTGKAVVHAGALRFGPLAATGKACITAPGGQEDMFFKAIEQTRSVRLEDGQLVLVNTAGKTLARLARAKQQP
ncbi:MAG: hypothetical protein A3F78_19535 [Burkholderiales bacterium RIFCSPLOWO2_12_FULL_61_40]|nr:MAG: hypothetical protein A3F78_19535 [Burkholderiales bacterium RIFCSPLOWO2_12_FULL_61_40]